MMKPKNRLKKKKAPFIIPALLSCGLLLFFLSACNLYESAENKSSTKAKKEDARMAIDRGNYEKAYNILYPMYQKNPEAAGSDLLQLLSNALSGQIGLDTFSVLEIADDLADGDTSGGIDLVGKVLSVDRTGTMTKDEIQEKLNMLYELPNPENAAPVQQMAPKSGPQVFSAQINGDDPSDFFTPESGAIFFLDEIQTKTNDHFAQLGLLSIVDTVLILADIIMEDLARDDIVLTENGIRDLYNRQGFDGMPAFQEVVETWIPRLNNNVLHIQASIDAIIRIVGGSPENNKLSKIFDEFLDEITDIDDKITYDSLNNFIRNL